MISALGADAPATQSTTEVWQAAKDKMPKPAPFEWPKLTPRQRVGALVLPGAIIGLVNRREHPFIWWAFGIIPAAWNVSQLIAGQDEAK